MRISDDDLARAAAWADASLRGRTPDECWALLGELMKVERGLKAAAYERAVELREQADEPWRGVGPADVVPQLRRELKESAHHDPRGDMMAVLRLEAMLRRVGPHISRRRWSKGLDPRTDLERWIHSERLRDAAYPCG